MVPEHFLQLKGCFLQKIVCVSITSISVTDKEYIVLLLFRSCKTVTMQHNVNIKIIYDFVGIYDISMLIFYLQLLTAFFKQVKKGQSNSMPVNKVYSVFIYILMFLSQFFCFFSLASLSLRLIFLGLFTSLSLLLTFLLFTAVQSFGPKCVTLGC